jgi:hypothetical protein
MHTNRNTTIGTGPLGPLVIAALGAWAAVAPFIVTTDEARAFRADGPLLLMPAAVAAVAGLGLLYRRRRPAQLAALLALAAGLCLTLWPLASILAPAHELWLLGDPRAWTLPWLVFYCGTGAVIATLCCHALGLLAPILDAADRPREPAVAEPPVHGGCGSRRRRGTPRRALAQRERIYAGARAHKHRGQHA